MTAPVTYTVKDPEDYIGGFVATGLVAIIQTVTPLLIGQLWKKDDREITQSTNPWYTYAWKAMQAGGVVSFGLQSLGFFATLIFDLGIFEKLGYLMTWFTHGVLAANLSVMTVVGYFIVGIAKFESNNLQSNTTEMWIVLASYVVAQIGLGLLFLTYARDTVMYMVAAEMKDICEKYGALCKDYGVMEADDDSTASAGSNLAVDTFQWDW